ncbi:hypothetical protein [Hyphobacterium marinum]|uniref:Lipoprotein n=1 Tax=Hyphobacterium marinum TaxID=3116574 RepID=A0ABU7LXU6_9PROT|nr:hypothetical protein [Hyphobacterium sp. Y6023]MEE2566377.1 hypothetical protein [Hyphobacterium sp. Y6023]
MKAFAGMTAVAGLTALLVACSPTEEADSIAAGMEAETVSLDPEGLHALLLTEADNLVPADWNTGEPVGEASLAYWHMPERHAGVTYTSACLPLADTPDGYDCTLTLSTPNQDDDAPEGAMVRAQFRFDVQAPQGGDLVLLDPHVRWAVTG